MADPPFSNYLDLIRPDIPESLISTAAFSQIQEFASRLPGLLAFSTFGFECRLGNRDAEADFLFSLHKNNSGPQILSGNLPKHDFDASVFEIPQWRQVRHFGRQWLYPPSPLFSGIDDVWLEFDLCKSPAHGSHAPSLFMAPFIDFSPRDQEALDLTDGLNIIQTIFEWLTGQKPDRRALSNWQKCLEILPSLRLLFQMGFMLARPQVDKLRMCIIAKDHQIARQYLRHIQWPGNICSVMPMLEQLSALFDVLYLHIDAGESISAKLGIECKFPKRKGPAREPRWFPFLDFLVDQGLCLAEKREGLLAFPGYRVTDRHTCLQPLRERIEKLQWSHTSFFVRTLYHIKLVYHVDQSWEAKGYLGIDHLWKDFLGNGKSGQNPYDII